MKDDSYRGALRNRARQAISKGPLSRLFAIPIRALVAADYVRQTVSPIPKWLLNSREQSNFTYHLDPNNLRSLAWFVANVSAIDYQQAHNYVHELLSDIELITHVAETAGESQRGDTDREFRPGKRLLYYTIARSIKPKLVVEAGCDKGLGSAVLAAALLRNRQEGHPGRLITIDRDPDSGVFFSGPYRQAGEMQRGSSPEIIAGLSESIDLFIHDTTAEKTHEISQFSALEKALSQNGFAISPWQTAQFLDFVESTGRQFLAFRDQSIHHWYPGSTVCVAYPRRHTHSDKPTTR